MAFVEKLTQEQIEKFCRSYFRRSDYSAEDVVLKIKTDEDGIGCEVRCWYYGPGSTYWDYRKVMESWEKILDYRFNDFNVICKKKNEDKTFFKPHGGPIKKVNNEEVVNKVDVERTQHWREYIIKFLNDEDKIKYYKALTKADKQFLEEEKEASKSLARYVYDCLEDENKKSFLTVLEKLFEEAKLSEKEKQYHLLSVEYDLPYSKIESHNGNRELIEEDIKKKKERVAKCVNKNMRRNELRKLFEDAGCKITSDDVSFKMFRGSVIEKNLYILQTRYVMLYKYASEKRAENFLRQVYNEYFHTKADLFEDRGYLAPIERIEKEAVDFVEKIENCPDDVANEILKKAEEYRESLHTERVQVPHL